MVLSSDNGQPNAQWGHGTFDGLGNVEVQVYHGTRYIDEVVGLRVKDLGRLYASQDANWNVTALTDLTGRVIERYWYSPYGELEAVVAAHPFDYDDDGDVDDDDYAVTTNGTCSGAASGDCRRLDANADGVVDSADQTAIAAYIATLNSDTELQRVPAATHSRRSNLFAHQGLVLDPEIGSYQNRARQYSPRAKRFMQRDPLIESHVARSGYADGQNLYVATAASPLARTDWSGHTSILFYDEGSTPGFGQVSGYDQSWPFDKCAKCQDYLNKITDDSADRLDIGAHGCTGGGGYVRCGNSRPPSTIPAGTLCGKMKDGGTINFLSCQSGRDGPGGTNGQAEHVARNSKCKQKNVTVCGCEESTEWRDSAPTSWNCPGAWSCFNDNNTPNKTSPATPPSFPPGV